jgi:hypothetical protein
MLTSERPRSFYGFPLPRLMLMYRFYPIIRSEFEARGRNGWSLVSDSDLFLGLRVHCTARREDISKVTAWGSCIMVLDPCGKPKLSASDFINEMENQLGIRAGMSHLDWEEAVQKMSKKAVQKMSEVDSGIVIAL